MSCLSGGNDTFMTIFCYIGDDEAGFVTSMAQVHRLTGCPIRRLRRIKTEGVGVYGQWIIATGEVQKQNKGQ